MQEVLDVDPQLQQLVSELTEPPCATFRQKLGCAVLITTALGFAAALVYGAPTGNFDAARLWWDAMSPPAAFFLHSLIEDG